MAYSTERDIYICSNCSPAGTMQERFGYASLDVTGSIDPYISTGIQRTLGKRFYIDVNVGFVGQGIGSSSGFSIQPFGDMQLGFRF